MCAFIILCSVWGCIGMEKTIRIDALTRLHEYTGKTVTVTGRISDVPWQHIIANEPGHPFSYYFDVGPEQTVIYAKTGIECGPGLTVTGTVIEVGTKSKKPGDDQTYREYQILVEDWVCE